MTYQNPFPRPSYSKSKVNWAGKILCNDAASLDDSMEATVIIEDWRASHRRPLTHINNHIRNLSKAVSPAAIIAQRLKRTPSIRHKLDRIPTMKLSTMQDIGGCRIVLTNLRQVRDMVNRILQSRSKHKLHHQKDYIANPKESGYRGIHLIYRYHSDTFREHCGLMVEIQVRTQLQHVWATGVETVGTFLRSPLKSSLGPEDWLEFFAKLSAAIHIKEREQRTYSRLPDFQSAASQLREIAIRLDASRRLRGFGTIIQHIEGASDKEDTIYLLHLRPVQGRITFYSYKSHNSTQAIQHYGTLEKNADVAAGEDVVLVHARSVQELKKAYPNYFMDTRTLVSELETLVPEVAQKQEGRRKTGTQQTLF